MLLNKPGLSGAGRSVWAAVRCTAGRWAPATRCWWHVPLRPSEGTGFCPPPANSGPTVFVPRTEPSCSPHLLGARNKLRHPDRGHPYPQGEYGSSWGTKGTEESHKQREVTNAGKWHERHTFRWECVIKMRAQLFIESHARPGGLGCSSPPCELCALISPFSDWKARLGRRFSSVSA